MTASISQHEGATATAEPVVRPRHRRRRKPPKPKRQPPYAVVLHNDDLNTFPFVVGVLGKVFGYDLQKSYVLTLRAHETGRSIVWTGTLELAELKADQIRWCGPDPDVRSSAKQPLKATVEPQPGS